MATEPLTAEKPSNGSRPMLLVDEVNFLRKRVRLQRAELRRLNKQIQGFWRGYQYHADVSHHVYYRAKMAKAFGAAAVTAAERAP